MRALVLALVASVAWAQSTPAPRFRRFTTRTEQGRNTRGLLADSFAFFEFAPASGAGMPAACSSTAPTGAKGEALTFTRTGSATCSKQGLATTGIANGDLVVLSDNQPRVEFDSQGVLGLRVESSRQNVLVRSEEFDNAAWVDDATPTAITVTINATTSPDGTTTSERLQIPATSGAQLSTKYQFITVSALSPVACSVYVRGNGTSGTADLCVFNGASWPCTPCSFVASSWSRCIATIASVTTGTTSACKFGNNSNQNGGVARSANDLFAWGFQGEAGAYATSYIPTTSAAVTRNAEIPTVNGNTLGLPTARYSLAASIQTLAPGAVSRGIVEGQVGASSGVGFFTVAGFLRTQNLTAGVDNTTDFAWTPTTNQLYRLATFNDGTNQSTIIDGTTVIGPVARTPPDSPWSTTTGIGYAPAFPAQLDGIISRVCIDPSASRCR